MDKMMHETLCGFVEDMYDIMKFDDHKSRRELMTAAERLARTPDIPKTRADAIYQFMVENGIVNARITDQTPDESRRWTAMVYAEKHEDDTLKYMRALDRDLGECIDKINEDAGLIDQISDNTHTAISLARFYLQTDNKRICDGRRPQKRESYERFDDMKSLHAENRAALDAFKTNDHKPNLMRDRTKYQLYFVTQMVNANHINVMLESIVSKRRKSA